MNQVRVRMKSAHCPTFIPYLTGKKDAKRNLIYLNEDNHPQSDFMTQKQLVFAEYTSKQLDAAFKLIAKQVQLHQRNANQLQTLTQVLADLSSSVSEANTPAATRTLCATQQKIQQTTQSLTQLEDVQLDIEADIRICSHETLQLLLRNQAILHRQISAYLKGGRMHAPALSAQDAAAFPEAQLENIETLKSFITYQNFLPDITLPSASLATA